MAARKRTPKSPGEGRVDPALSGKVKATKGDPLPAVAMQIQAGKNEPLLRVRELEARIEAVENELLLRVRELETRIEAMRPVVEAARQVVAETPTNMRVRFDFARALHALEKAVQALPEKD